MQIHVIVFCVLQWIPLAIGGVCWKRLDSSTNLCLDAFTANVTYTECCNHTGSASLSWSPHTVPGDIFYHNFLSGGADHCQRCHTNCSSVTCDKGEVCQLHGDLPVCVCKTNCTIGLQHRGRLCGTDRRVYKNVCTLMKRNCIEGNDVEVEHFGKCKASCKHVNCEPGKRCLEDQNGLPHCVVCPGRCTRTIADPHPVCGVNGVTYAHPCILKAAICRKGKSINTAYEGKCNASLTCSNYKCPFGQFCLTNPASGQPVCRTCGKICLPTDYKPICGTDGQSYSTYCNMIMSSCKTRIFVTTKRSGYCRKQSKIYAIDKLKQVHNDSPQILCDVQSKCKRSRLDRSHPKRRKQELQIRREKKRKKLRKRKPKSGTKQLQYNVSKQETFTYRSPNST